MSIEDKLQIAYVKVMQRSPYFCDILYSLRPNLTEDLPTIAACDRNLNLFINPKMFVGLSPEESGGVICHEIQHILRGFWARQMGRPIGRWNIAQDLAINSDLEGCGWKLPENVVRPSQLKFMEGLTSEEYYDLLVKNSEESKDCSSSCCQKEASQGLDGDGVTVSEDEIERIVERTALNIKEHAESGIGNVSKGLKMWAQEVLGVSEIPWQRKLSFMVRRSVRIVMGRSDYSYKRPSRRYREMRGMPYMPSMVSYSPQIDIVVDTSGSMSGLMKECFTEVMAITRVFETVTYVGDTKLLASKRVRRATDLDDFVVGGGGTDMGAVYREIPKKGDVCVLLTDGYTITWPESDKAKKIAVVIDSNVTPPDGWEVLYIKGK